jgi:hypothetical protein
LYSSYIGTRYRRAAGLAIRTPDVSIALICVIIERLPHDVILWGVTRTFVRVTCTHISILRIAHADHYAVLVTGVLKQISVVISPPETILAISSTTYRDAINA